MPCNRRPLSRRLFRRSLRLRRSTGARVDQPGVGPLVSRDDDSPASVWSRHLGGRLAVARRDRILLSRFLAMVMLLVAAINMAPAIDHWYRWSRESLGAALPAWTYVQIFVAALHVVYAVFVFQVPDWSSLKAVSVFLLTVAAVYGFIAAALWTGGIQGNVASWLGLSTLMLKDATIWCVAMLLLATMAALVVGREASNWQRTERVYHQILSRNSAS